MCGGHSKRLSSSSRCFVRALLIFEIPPRRRKKRGIDRFDSIRFKKGCLKLKRRRETRPSRDFLQRGATFKRHFASSASFLCFWVASSSSFLARAFALAFLSSSSPKTPSTACGASRKTNSYFRFSFVVRIDPVRFRNASAFCENPWKHTHFNTNFSLLSSSSSSSFVLQSFSIATAQKRAVASVSLLLLLLLLLLLRRKRRRERRLSVCASSSVSKAPAFLRGKSVFVFF